MSQASSKVPSLTRALHCLEVIAGAEEGISFGHLLERVEAPRASFARILEILRERDYIARDSKTRRYILGPIFGRLGNQADLLSPFFKEKVSQTLLELRREKSVSAGFFSWEGDVLRLIETTTDPSSVSFNRWENTTNDLSTTPWGWTIYLHLDQESQPRMEKQMVDVASFRKSIGWVKTFYSTRGFVYDPDCNGDPIRRLAVPVFKNVEKKGDVWGVLAICGNPTTLPDDALLDTGNLLIQKAQTLNKTAPSKC